MDGAHHSIELPADLPVGTKRRIETEAQPLSVSGIPFPDGMKVYIMRRSGRKWDDSTLELWFSPHGGRRNDKEPDLVIKKASGESNLVFIWAKAPPTYLHRIVAESIFFHYFYAVM